MTSFSIIKTKPSLSNYYLFEEVVGNVYKKDSPRFVYGNEPASEFLVACYVLLQNKKPIGRFAYYRNENISYKEKKVVSIGSYECIESPEASAYLLAFAKELAKADGFPHLLGPMEGSTWQNYRFSTHNKEANFFMEPYHHSYYNRQFLANGFNKTASYFSNLAQINNLDFSKVADYERYYKDKGAIVRTIDLSNFENELYRIGEFSNTAFSGNFLYSPMSPTEFVTKYTKIKSLINPKLVWLVEDEVSEIQALIFGVPDILDASKKTFIIKSMARKKDSDYKGIGTFLAGKLMQTAQELGFTKVIHALMIKDNASVRISEAYQGKAYKDYALYVVKL